MEFLAKSKGGLSLKQHSDDVVRHAQAVLTLYGEHFTEEEKFAISLACEVHDIGKVDTNFQKLLKGEYTDEEMVRHEFLSTLMIDFKYLKTKHFDAQPVDVSLLKAILTAVYYSHNRLFTSQDLKTYGTKFVEANAKSYLSSYDTSSFNPKKKLFYTNLKKLIFEVRAGAPASVSLDDYLKYVKIKGILNAADYLASSEDNELITLEKPVPTGEQSLPSLILKHMSDKGFSLFPAQKYLSDHINDNVILIAPAGSGKTEGSMLWLGENKGFYTLPLKVASTAIWRRLREVYDYQDVALLHSDALSQVMKGVGKEEESEKMLQYDMMRKKCYPLSVCTMDQIFKFVFKSLGTEIFAAQLSYSRVIIDEVQMYSPKLMAQLCYGIKLVHLLGGKFLIMTATLPEMVNNYFRDEQIPFEFEEFAQGGISTRHNVEVRHHDFFIDQILSEGREKKVLVLCNTVKKAQSVYSKLINQGVSVQILHSNFIKKHRSGPSADSEGDLGLEGEILAFAGKECERKEPGIWVSTQIVEASLDIDFDVLHTEMCTIDSLLQRMGRCYRTRLYESMSPNIFVYNTTNGKAKPDKQGVMRGIYDADIYDFSLQAIMKYQCQLLTEKMKMNMVKEVFATERLQHTEYYREFYNNLDKLEKIEIGDISKAEANYFLREISAVTVIPQSVYKDNKEKLDEWAEKYQNKSLNRLERQTYKDCIMDFCLSITKPKDGYPKGVHSMPMASFGDLDIHLCEQAYYFIEADKRGLVRDEIEEPLFG